MSGASRAAGRWLLVGFSKALLGGVGGLPDGSVTVLEEPDVWRKKGLAEAVAGYPMVGEVLFSEYFESSAFLEVVVAAHAASPFGAVVPGVEYAVPAAALAAARLGLPGAGVEAARTLRDKLRLRETASAAGVANPRFAEVRSGAEIRRFAGSGPVVVKPAGRQASLGVHLLDRLDDAEALWETVRGEREGPQLPDRELPMRFLAEERLRGPEHSVEALVAGGEPVFVNVTRKTVLEGEFPVETAHLLPAPLERDTAGALDRAMRALLAATGFGTGIVHAEWILTGTGPVLVECAGRLPGDHIMDLLGLAYDLDPFAALVDLLHGRSPRAPGGAARAAAIGFVVAPAGVVRRVGSVEAALAQPGVTAASLTAEPGAVLGPCRSSWDRLGHAIVVGADAAEAERRLRDALEALAVETEPAGAG